MTYVDSDGVLADFDSFIASKDPTAVGVGNKITRIMYEYADELYLNFNQMPGSEYLFEQIRNNKDWFVLTAVSKVERLMRVCSEEDAIACIAKFKENKYKWFERHGIDRTKVIIVDSADDKVCYCKSGNDILYDNFEKNINLWNAAGGKGILVQRKTE